MSTSNCRAIFRNGKQIRCLTNQGWNTYIEFLPLQRFRAHSRVYMGEACPERSYWGTAAKRSYKCWLQAGPITIIRSLLWIGQQAASLPSLLRQFALTWIELLCISARPLMLQMLSVTWLKTLSTSSSETQRKKKPHSSNARLNFIRVTKPTWRKYICVLY